MVIPRWLVLLTVFLILILLAVSFHLVSGEGRPLATALLIQLIGGIATGLVVTTCVQLLVRSWLRPERWELLLGQAGIHAVYPYTKEGRQTRDQREVDLLTKARTIDLLAITGATYLIGTGPVAESFRKAASRGARIRLLLLDPASLLARQRGARENGCQPGDYDWAHHRESVLFKKHQLSLACWEELAKDSPSKPEVRIYSIPPTCSMLLLSESVFVDQYHFGTKDAHLPDGLGEDYPVFEYRSVGAGVSTYQLAQSHFEWIWQNSKAPLRHPTNGGLGTSSTWNSKEIDDPYRLVHVHDSWLAVDPVLGCPNGCSYCVLRPRGLTPRDPTWMYTEPRAVVDVLKRSSVDADVPLSIGNMTDLFLPSNVARACKTIVEIAKAFPQRTLCIPTKQEVSLRDLDVLDPYKGQILFLISYSGLDGSLEPRIRRENIEATLRNLHERGFRALHYWRPVVEENATKQSVERVFDAVRGRTLASIVRGLKPFSQTLDTIPEAFWENLKQVNPPESKLRHPVYLHTSCAIAYANQKPDYNATQWHRQACTQQNAVVACPIEQIDRCKKAMVVPKEDRVRKELIRLRPELASHPFEVSIGDRQLSLSVVKPIATTTGETTSNQLLELTDEEYRSLLHAVRFPIRCTVRSADVWQSSIFHDTENTVRGGAPTQ
jgi:DNA repair photolyase